MSVLFIADLHLQEQRPDLTRAFLRFIRQKASRADALYILGDLFEAWVGDDDGSTIARSVTDALKQLSDSGVSVYLQHGNRDFLMGQELARSCGATLLPETHTIAPYDQPLLLMHGDQLCLDDTEYQTFRQQVRSSQWQQAILAKPLEERRNLAAAIRQESRLRGQQIAEDIVDVTASEVERTLDAAGVDILIHGHTHRPAVHRLKNNRLRIVLGDWGPSAWYLEWHPDNSYQLVDYPIE